MMLLQTKALFLDAYREMNAKRIFWVVLILNVLVILGFAALGFNDHTITIFGRELLPDFPAPAFAYKMIFSTRVVNIWFTWIAALLALISTAGIIPDFLTSGSIDLYLSRPIGRVRLFLTKYVSGLLFVTIQVALFALMSFLVLGIRGGMWEPGLFWSIPLVILFFSYLFSMCALLGVMTRSTLTALMLTLLAWAFIWGVDLSETGARQRAYQLTVQADMLSDRIDDIDVRVSNLKQANDADAAKNIADLNTRRAELVSERDRTTPPPELVAAENILYGIKTVVPKTRETIDLLNRVLFQDKELADMAKAAEANMNPPGQGPRGGPRNQRARELEQMVLDRQRSIGWIIGTSLAFEAVMLALACWIFATRDY